MTFGNSLALQNHQKNNSFCFLKNCKVVLEKEEFVEAKSRDNLKRHHDQENDENQVASPPKVSKYDQKNDQVVKNTPKGTSAKKVEKSHRVINDQVSNEQNDQSVTSNQNEPKSQNVDKNESNLQSVHFLCTKCNRKYPYKQVTISHLKQIHKIFHKNYEEYVLKNLITKVVSYENFKCNICGEDFKKEFSLHIHQMKIHKEITQKENFVKSKEEEKLPLQEKKPQKSPIKIDPKIAKIRESLKYGRMTKPTACQYCGKIYTTALPLQNHITKMHSGEKLQKVTCDADLKSHISKIHENSEQNQKSKEPSEENNQSKVEKKTIDKKSLKNANEKPPKEFKKVELKENYEKLADGKVSCKLCGKIFNFEIHLKNHLKYIHHQKMIPEPEMIKNEQIKNEPKKKSSAGLKCEKCQRIFRNENVLKKHDLHCNKTVTTNAELKPKNDMTKCEICQKNFLKKFINIHMETMHSGHQEPTPKEKSSEITCTKCKEILPNVKLLERHMYTFHQSKICHICDKKFQDHESLENHLAKDHTEKNEDNEPQQKPKPPAEVKQKSSFSCEKCHKPFQYLKSLKNHTCQKSPLKFDKPVECENCGHSFIYAKRLKDHKCGSRPSKNLKSCEYCEKKFSYETSLKTHIFKEHMDQLKAKMSRGVTISPEIKVKQEVPESGENQPILGKENVVKKFLVFS